MDSAHLPELTPAADNMEERDTAATHTGGKFSVAAAAERLGVSRSAVWHMIADGKLDAEYTCRHGRVYTQVQLPRLYDGDPDDAPARSRTARLQEQVERLTLTLERLTAVLLEANRERAEMRQTLRSGTADEYPATHERQEAESAPQTSVPSAEQATPTLERERVAPQPVSVSTGWRPNPMTHPSERLRARPTARDELLDPVRELFKGRQRAWWQRLPLMSRG